ncbi:UDP-glycosyltransferase UGT5 isoform X2 [Diabrotica virgifera virgifera]|uniref:UDP-glucuronosyltransferase n=1 Tax=Diabrotica virgifera virgifera TaxID=50390 RepID=A0A6P7F0I8_DIAVI|nr:UDP-glycosyltransferase UGT5 isoform X2 [Diabrotica virgifera virgifera]
MYYIKFIVLILSAFIIIPRCDSLNVLFMITFFGPSHFLVFKPLAEELSRRGHNVTVIVNSKISESDHYRAISIADDSVKPGDIIPMSLFSGTRFDQYKRATAQAEYSKMNCLRMGSNKFQNFLKENNTFDVIVAEVFNTNCFFGLMKIYDAPIVGLSSTDLLPWMYQWYGSPENPSYIPVLFMDYSDKLSFFQRVENTLMLLFSKLVHLYSIAPTGNEYSKKYLGVDLFEGGDILYNMSLLLTNRHYTYQTPKPLSPNIIEVGGIHLDKPKKLPETLDKLVSSAPNGVILISMGSTLKGSTFPEEQRKMFLKVFSQLKYTVIWKWENDTMEGLPSNVKLHKWLPQFDLLCHPNLKLFITHGGLLGGQEAVYCGVPMLILPQFADQHLNAASLEKTGASLHIKLRSATEKSLTEAINKVLRPEYAQNAKLLSERFKDRPMSPMDTAIYWIEYVAKYKGAPFMRTAVTDMPFYQYLLLDVIGFLFLIGAIFIYIFYFCTKRIIRLVIKTSTQSKIKKH